MLIKRRLDYAFELEFICFIKLQHSNVKGGKVNPYSNIFKQKSPNIINPHPYITKKLPINFVKK